MTIARRTYLLEARRWASVEAGGSPREAGEAMEAGYVRTVRIMADRASEDAGDCTKKNRDDVGVCTGRG